MAVRSIRLLGDPVLRARASEVVDFDRPLRRLVKDLGDTMVEANGVGLAAPQLGIGLRVFTYLVPSSEDDDGGHVAHLVNPSIAEEDPDQVEDDEGCLSVPGISYPLKRPRRVVARGFDGHGEPVEVTGTLRLARCILHETDHLNGVIFLDRLEPELRREALKEFRERMLAGESIQVEKSPHRPLL
ncbi:MAG: peptide deformylase [Actinomycetota bacterium]|nr:peptide deformylase [Actinomycetota bacterium]